MTTKAINLNISERLFTLTVLNAFKGDLDKLAVVLEDIKQLPIEDAEWEKAERIIEASQWRWNDEKCGLKIVALHCETMKYLLDTIDKKNKDGEFTLQDRAVISLQDKLVSK